MSCIGLIHNGRIAELVDYSEILGTMMFPSDSKKHRLLVPQLVEAIRKQPPGDKIAPKKWDLQMSRFSESGVSFSELDRILYVSLSSQLIAEAWPTSD